jgi:hypothetical protein
MKNLGSYKTTLAALAVVVLAVCFKQGWLDQETVMTAGLVATALGLGFAKDHNVTGGTKRIDKPKDPQP